MQSKPHGEVAYRRCTEGIPTTRNWVLTHDQNDTAAVTWKFSNLSRPPEAPFERSTSYIPTCIPNLGRFCSRRMEPNVAIPPFNRMYMKALPIVNPTYSLVSIRGDELRTNGAPYKVKPLVTWTYSNLDHALDGLTQRVAPAAKSCRQGLHCSH